MFLGYIERKKKDDERNVIDYVNGYFCMGDGIKAPCEC